MLSINTLDLSKKEKKALAALSINTIEQFKNLNIEKVRSLSGYGQSTIDKLLQKKREILKPGIKSTNNSNVEQQSVFIDYDNLVSTCFKTTVRQPWANSYSGSNSYLNHFAPLLNAPADYSSESILALSIKNVLEIIQPSCVETLNNLSDIKLSEIINTSDLMYFNKLNPATAGDCINEIITCSLGKLLQVIPEPHLFDLILGSVFNYLKVDLHSDSFKMLLCGLSISSGFCCEITKIEPLLLAFINKLPISSAFIPISVIAELTKEYQISNYSELINTSENTILFKKGLNNHSLVCIRCIWAVITSLTSYKIDLFANLTNFRYHFTDVKDVYFYLFSDLVKKPAQLEAICSRHIYNEQQRPNTLEQIGKKCGYTRERTRQLINKFDESLQNSPTKRKLHYIWFTAHSLLFSKGGILNLNEFTDILGKFILENSCFSVKNIIELLELSSSFTINDKNEYIKLTQYPCGNCPVLLTNLEKVLDSNARYYNICDISLLVSTNCPPKCSIRNIAQVHPYYIKEAILKSTTLSTKWNIIDNWILRHEIFEICNSNLENGLIYFMQLIGVPLHISAVPKQYQAYLPITKKISRFRAHMILMASPEILMWGRGTYVHRKNVIIDFNVEDMFSFIDKQLSCDKPFLTAYELFNYYLKNTTNPQIPNEQALYDAIRAQEKNTFHLPRFPYIYNGESSKKNNIVQLVETLVEARGVAVSISELEIFVRQHGGFKFPLSIIQSIPTLLRVAEGAYNHINNINIQKEQLKSIFEYILDETKKYPSISVVKVFDNKLVTCHVAGIDNPIMLYSILSVECPYDIEFPRFPNIIGTANNDNTITVRYFAEAVMSFIEQANRPLAFEELQQEFAKNRGYSSTAIYNLIANRGTELGLIKCAKSFIISTTLIGWNAQKQQMLVETAKKEYDSNHSKEQPFYTASALIEDATLPDLNGIVHWSEVLLSDLLELSTEFIVLGNMRNAYLPKINNYGITTFGELVHYVLKNNFNGIAKFDDLSELLQEQEVVIKSVTPSMLVGYENIRYNETVVYISEMEAYVKKP